MPQADAVQRVRRTDLRGLGLAARSIRTLHERSVYGLPPQVLHNWRFTRPPRPRILEEGHATGTAQSLFLTNGPDGRSYAALIATSGRTEPSVRLEITELVRKAYMGRRGRFARDEAWSEVTLHESTLVVSVH